MSLRIGIGVLVFLLICTMSFAQENRLQELQKKVLEQQKILNQLEQKLENKETTTRNYTEKIVSEYMSEPSTQEKSGLVAGYDKGFFVKSADGNIELKINGYLRHHLFIGENDSLQNNTFRATESRIDFNVYINKDWHIRIRPDFSANASIREAYVEYLGVDYLKVRAGAFIAPFSMEYLTAPTDLLAIMYSPYLASIPLRDVGVMLFGNGLPFLLGEFFADYFSYEAGIFNGDGMNNLSRDDDFMFVAAATIHPLTNKEKDFFFRTAVMTNDTIFRGTGARLGLYSILGSPYTVFGNGTEAQTKGNQVAVSAAFRYIKDNLRIEGETVWARYNREATNDNSGNIVNDLDPLELWGASLGISYFFAMGKPENKMGFEPLFKFSYTTIDDKRDIGGVASETVGQDVWEIVFGAKFHINQHTRVDFNWAMYDLEQNTNYPNKSTGANSSIIHSFIFQFMVKW